MKPLRVAFRLWLAWATIPAAARAGSPAPTSTVAGATIPGSPAAAAPGAGVKASAPSPSGPSAAPPRGPASGGVPVAGPPPEIGEAFKFLEGTWKCEVRFSADAFGAGSPPMAATATLKVKRDLDGFFYRGEYEIKKTKTMPAFRALIYLGHQPAVRLYTLTLLDSAGSLELATSPGFAVDEIAFQGEAYSRGRRIQARETLTKRGPTAFSRKTELEVGKGLQVIADDTCKR